MYKTFSSELRFIIYEFKDLNNKLELVIIQLFLKRLSVPSCVPSQWLTGGSRSMHSQQLTVGRSMVNSDAGPMCK